MTVDSLPQNTCRKKVVAIRDKSIIDAKLISNWKDSEGANKKTISSQLLLRFYRHFFRYVFYGVEPSLHKILHVNGSIVTNIKLHKYYMCLLQQCVVCYIPLNFFCFSFLNKLRCCSRAHGTIRLTLSGNEEFFCPFIEWIWEIYLRAFWVWWW